MAQVVLSRAAITRLAEIRDFYTDAETGVAERAFAAIFRSLRILEAKPMIGRPVIEPGGLRELVIPFGAAGYVALYRYDEAAERIAVLALRHQREAGYAERDLE